MSEVRKTMTVPQMRKMLGLKKTESYWLVHRNFFKTDIVNGHMMIDVESFEKWYANQVKHRKVDGPEPGAELTSMSYSFSEVAKMLGVSSAVVYEIWDKNDLDILDEDRKKNAQLIEDAFYKKENLNPDMKRLDTGKKKIEVPDGIDAEALMKVLNNPEMAALLAGLAKGVTV